MAFRLLSLVILLMCSSNVFAGPICNIRKESNHCSSPCTIVECLQDCTPLTTHHEEKTWSVCHEKPSCGVGGSSLVYEYFEQTGYSSGYFTSYPLFPVAPPPAWNSWDATYLPPIDLCPAHPIFEGSFEDRIEDRTCSTPEPSTIILVLGALCTLCLIRVLKSFGSSRLANNTSHG